MINEAMKGLDASDIYAVDAAMIAADGTKDKSNLEQMQSLQYLSQLQSSSNCSGDSAVSFPWRSIRKQSSCTNDEYLKRWMPCITSGLDVQEFMIMPVGAPSFKEA